MKRSSAILIGALALLLLGGLLVWWQLGNNNSESTAEAPPAPVTKPAPGEKLAGRPSTPPPPQAEPAAIAPDDDPEGPLLLEGQVLDGDDHGLGGAVVHLSSNPGRTTTTEQDGTFVFDKLIGRSYRLEARTEGLVGGPVMHELTANSDPVVIRMHTGAKVQVTVVSSSTGTPLPAATVGIDRTEPLTATTDDAGIATITAVSGGGHTLWAKAPGYATARQYFLVPETDSDDTTVNQQIELQPGAAVAGRVVDKSGAPVVGAKVVQNSVSRAFSTTNPRLDGVATDDNGRFELRAVPAGTYRFTSVHDNFAPATTEAMEVAASGRADVEIVMEAGGIIAGRVTTTDGKPAAWATVEIDADPEANGAAGAQGPGSSRQAIADEQGKFRFTGLVRTKLVAHASSSLATSELVDVDLVATSERTDLALKLSIDGIISGEVVDENGEPISEAQVMAQPDFLEGADFRQLVVRGPSFAHTDGGGKFTLRGLPPDGIYRLFASRTKISLSMFSDSGTAARTGDDNVRVVLAARGGVAGKVQLSDGSTPELATVSVTIAGSIPITDGSFLVDTVPPGSYDVTLRGPDFADKIIPKVIVSPGKVTDLGTITVERGRAVKGRVLDNGGGPVSGAQVLVGRQIVSDGNNLSVGGVGSMLDDQFGLRHGTTDAVGAFRISGIGDDKLVIVADHDTLGRSPATRIVAGEQDVTLELRLAEMGGIAGAVTRNDEPAEGVQVMVAPRTGAEQIVMVRTGPDGRYAVEKIAAGEYKVTAMAGGGVSSSMTGTIITVKPRAITTADLNIVEGNITYQVTVAGKDGAEITIAQVFLFEGKVNPKNAEQLQKIFLNASESGGAKMALTPTVKPAVFKKVSPGSYSMCVIPITGDMSDRAFVQRLQRHTRSLEVHCQRIKIAQSPDDQSLTVEVPAMAPLPEDK